MLFICLCVIFFPAENGTERACLWGDVLRCLSACARARAAYYHRGCTRGKKKKTKKNQQKKHKHIIKIKNIHKLLKHDMDKIYNIIHRLRFALFIHLQKPYPFLYFSSFIIHWIHFF